MNKSKKMVLCALFISSYIALGRFFSIKLPIVTIGFSFVPLIFSAILLGPKYSAFVATFGDVIGALLFPNGSYFFGFTLTSFLTGFTYGLFLYKKDFRMNKAFIMKLVISVFLITIIFHLGLNTLWIIMLTKEASKIIIFVRLIKQILMIPIKIVTILSLCKILEERMCRLLYDSIK